MMPRPPEAAYRKISGADSTAPLRTSSCVFLAYTSIWPESYTPRPGVPPRNIAPADSAFRSEAWIAAALGPRMGVCPAARISSPCAGPLTTRLPAYPPLSFGTPKRARPLNDSAGCRPMPAPSSRVSCSARASTVIRPRWVPLRAASARRKAL